ncbi:MAG: hypothetical protein ACRENL_01900 [Candidatus Dormibacteria bacterium]
MTELIVRELRLRRFEVVAPVARPCAAPAAATIDDTERRLRGAPGVERLAVRHSRRRGPPDGLSV